MGAYGRRWRLAWLLTAAVVAHAFNGIDDRFFAAMYTARLQRVAAIEGVRRFEVPLHVTVGTAVPHLRRTQLPSLCAPQYGGVAHAGVLVSDTDSALKFYTQVLGMEDETHLRPNLPFPGAFVRAGTQQIHIMELPNPDPVDGRPEHGGRDRHIALTVESLAPLKAKLDEAQVTFTMSKSGRAALFCRDPDGNAFEFMETPGCTST